MQLLYNETFTNNRMTHDINIQAWKQWPNENLLHTKCNNENSSYAFKRNLLKRDGT